MGGASSTFPGGGKVLPVLSMTLGVVEAVVEVVAVEKLQGREKKGGKEGVMVWWWQRCCEAEVMLRMMSLMFDVH